MSDAFLYSYPSPLEGYENLEPLSKQAIRPNHKLPHEERLTHDERSEKHADGKSLVNPPSTTRSTAYDEFVSPISNGIRGGFDIHIYFQPNNASELKFATELHERVRREFPELRVYRVWEQPIGPHPVGMFEVNVFNPHQFGAFVAWLVINRGPLSALVHPNTDEEVRDHSQRATWLGERFPLDLGRLYEGTKAREEEKKKKAGEEGKVNGSA